MEIIGLERGTVGNYQPANSENVTGIVVKIPLISIISSGSDKVLDTVFSVKWVVDVYGENDQLLFSGYANKRFALKLEHGEELVSSNLFSLVRQVGDFFNEEGKRSDIFIPIRNLDYLISPDDMVTARAALQEEVDRWNETNGRR